MLAMMNDTSEREMFPAPRGEAKEFSVTLQVIVERYRGCMLKTAMRYDMGPLWAERIVSEVLCSFAADPERLKAFRIDEKDEQSLHRSLAWLRAVVGEHALCALKQEKDAARDSAPAPISIVAHAIPDDLAAGYQECSSKDLLEQIDAFCSEQLSAGLLSLEVLRLRLLHGARNCEVAAALGISEKFADKLFRRTRKAWKIWMARREAKLMKMQHQEPSISS